MEKSDFQQTTIDTIMLRPVAILLVTFAGDIFHFCAEAGTEVEARAVRPVESRSITGGSAVRRPFFDEGVIDGLSFSLPALRELFFGVAFSDLATPRATDGVDPFDLFLDDLSLFSTEISNKRSLRASDTCLRVFLVMLLLRTSCDLYS